jgi:hypothetical protein
LQFLFDYKGQIVAPDKPIPIEKFNADGSTDDINVLDAVKDLLTKFSKLGQPLPASMQTVRVTVTPASDTATLGVVALNQLEIKFTKANYSFYQNQIDVAYDAAQMKSVAVPKILVKWSGDPTTVAPMTRIQFKTTLGGKTINIPDPPVAIAFQDGSADITAQTKDVLDRLLANMQLPAKPTLPECLQLIGIITAPDRQADDTSNSLEIRLTALMPPKKDEAKKVDAKKEEPKEKEPAKDNLLPKPMDGPKLGAVRPLSPGQGDSKSLGPNKDELKKDIFTASPK